MQTQPQSSFVRPTRLCRRGRRRQFARLVLALLVATVALTPLTAVNAGTLNGLVRNEAGTPLNNVRVDLVGPAKRVTATDSKGEFSVDAPGGTYQLIITYSGKRVRTDINLPAGSESIKKTFTLDW